MNEFFKNNQTKISFSSRSFRVDAEAEGDQVYLRDNSETYKNISDDRIEAVFAIADGLSEKSVFLADKASYAAVLECREGLNSINTENDESIEESIAEIYRRANRKIRAMQQAESVIINSNLTSGFFIDGRMHIGHIGNCRVYRFNQDKVEQVTTDQDAAIPPPPSLDEGNSHEIGDNEPPSIFFYRFEPEQGETILFCTDGVYSVLSEQEISFIMSSGGSPARTCEQIIDRVRLKNPDDDATAIVVKFDSIRKKEEAPDIAEMPKNGDKAIKEGKKPVLTLFVLLLLTAFCFTLFMNSREGIKAGKIAGNLFSLLKRNYPRMTIVSNTNIKSIKYNTREIGSLLKNNRGAVKLKTELSRFDILPDGIYLLRFEYPKSAKVEVDSGNENIINADGNFIGVWIHPDSLVTIDRSSVGKKTIVTVKSVDKKIQVNLLSPENASIKIEQGP